MFLFYPFQQVIIPPSKIIFPILLSRVSPPGGSFWQFKFKFKYLSLIGLVE